MIMEAVVTDEGTFLFTDAQHQEHWKQKRSQSLRKWRCHSNQSRGCIVLVLLISLISYWLFLSNPKTNYPSLSNPSNPNGRNDASRKMAGASKELSKRKLSSSSSHREKNTDFFVHKWPKMNGKILNHVQTFYSYRLSFFDKVVQRDNVDASIQIVLGYFDGIDEKTGAILLRDGDKCAFTGSPRSGEILMKCSTGGSALSVQESPKCFYTFQIEDPELCTQDVSISAVENINDNEDSDSNAKRHADVHTSLEAMEDSNEFSLKEKRREENWMMKRERQEAEVMHKKLKEKRIREQESNQKSSTVHIDNEGSKDEVLKGIALITNIKSRQRLESNTEFSKTFLAINGHQGIMPCRRNPRLCGDSFRGSFMDGKPILPRVTDVSAITMLNNKYQCLNGRTFVTSNPKRSSTVSFELKFFHYVLEFTGEDDSRDSHLVGMFDGYDQNGHMRLINGDPSPRCELPRSGVIVLACGQQSSVFVYSHSCEYQFTVIDPGACDDSSGHMATKSSLVFNPVHPQPNNALGHHSIMHYEKFGKHLKGTSIETIMDHADCQKKYHLKFFDKLTFKDTNTEEVRIVGYFNGIESFRRDAIRLSNGDFCAEIGDAASGILTMKCGHKKSLRVIEKYPCIYHATFYDDHPDCSTLADNLW